MLRVQNRAYSLLTIRSVDDDLRIIEGIASTPSTDRMGDIVDPKGAEFTLPIPLLWQHNAREPLGHVIAAKVTDAGIEIRAQIAKAGLLPRIDEAWTLLKAGLVRGLSIGFRPTKDPEQIKGTFGVRFTGWEWLELSAVTVAANSDASITTIKSLDAPFLAATGGEQAPTHAGTPRDRGTAVRMAKKDAATTMTNITEQISGFEATRQAKDAERKGLMDEAAKKGETLDTDASEKYDAISTEIKSIDAHLVRLREMEESNKSAAVAVSGQTVAAAAASRGGQAISVKENRPAGIGFARVAIAKLSARLEGCTVMEIVKSRWPSDSTLHAYFQKATIPAGLTTDATWAGNLVDQTNLESEFIDYLRPQTIVGRIPGLRRVPFNVRITGQTTGAVAGWVGQGKPKPVTSFSTTAITLLYTKIAAIAVISEELARFSSPSAEALVRDELARAVIERMDVDFVDPAQAEVTNVSPASITNGVTPLTSAGTSADNIRTDIQNLIEQFILNNMNASNLVFIMPNTLALAASILRNSLGQPEFPELTMNGGTLLGRPVVTSQYAANQSGSGNLVIALDPSAIFMADDGTVKVDASREASIQMSDAPTNDAATGTGQSLVSMYQTNSIAIRAERYINWKKARATAVAFIDDANWGSIGSPS